MRLRSGALALVLVGAALGACAPEGEAEPVEVSGTRVDVGDSWFAPEAIEVAEGEDVTWVWEGRANHNVVGEGFESDVQRDGTFTHTFAEAGEHPYVCTLHPGMEGMVVVGAR